MGWDPSEVGKPQYLIVSTPGGLRAEDGTPVALDYHIGHWEIGLRVRDAIRSQGLSANPVKPGDVIEILVDHVDLMELINLIGPKAGERRRGG
jgi:hypothetical protein